MSTCPYQRITAALVEREIALGCAGWKLCVSNCMDAQQSMSSHLHSYPLARREMGAGMMAKHCTTPSLDHRLCATHTLGRSRFVHTRYADSIKPRRSVRLGSLDIQRELQCHVLTSAVCPSAVVTPLPVRLVGLGFLISLRHNLCR